MCLIGVKSTGVERHVSAFLTDLAVTGRNAEHHPRKVRRADRTRNYIRGLLVEHGALPRRDELTVRYDQWATSALDRVSSDDHRDVVRGTSPTLPKSEQDVAVERVVHTDELTARDRAAAILVVVFGQRLEDVIRLTWDDVTVTEDVVTIRLGKTEFALASPLDEPLRQLAAAPGNDLTASHPNSNWVFRGYSPGQHIHGASLRQRLKVVFSTQAARLGTLHELTKLGPVPMIADELGYHPATIERQAIGSASAYSQYIAARRQLASSPTGAVST